MTHPTIAILDFGSQYLQLIARRVRENQVHSLIFAPGASPETLHNHNVIGIILSGGPASTYEGEAPKPDPGQIPHDGRTPLVRRGFGLGVERTIAWLCGLKHIRETIPFPRMMGRFYP